MKGPPGAGAQLGVPEGDVKVEDADIRFRFAT